MDATGKLRAGLQPGAGWSGPRQEEGATARAARPGVEDRAPSWKEAVDDEADGDALGQGSEPLARFEELGDRRECGPAPGADVRSGGGHKAAEACWDALMETAGRW
jgi:hypothetical protein